MVWMLQFVAVTFVEFLRTLKNIPVVLTHPCIICKKKLFTHVASILNLNLKIVTFIRLTLKQLDWYISQFQKVR